MNGQASFSLRGRNPDVLTCIANLSNDEVFTPPEFAGKMLDTLAEVWAADNKGANIWADKEVRFLDPFTKSGVFLREITSRLTKGLEAKIPNLETRVNHILTKQVFGIGITHLTSLLARRSLYCSKHAKGKHSIAKTFAEDDGNIWFKRMEHSWDGAKCRFCGAPRTIFDRKKGLETHAYAFIHTDDIKDRIGEIFGGNMQFDVIIGNPPYQMTGGGGGFDSSIYHLFVEQAIRLEPRYLSMVTPSRWMAGGHGMDNFRAEMLSSGKLRELIDYPVSKDVFPGVEVKGGICYFLWEHSHHGQTNVTTIRGEEVVGPIARDLNEFDVLVRDHRAVEILNKVLSRKEPSVSDVLTGVEPFKWASNFADYREKPKKGDIPLYYAQRGKRGIGYVSTNQVEKSHHLINTWKVLMPKAGSDGGQKIPDVVLGKPWIAPSPSVCTGTFIFYHVASQAEAKSVQSYYTTKFFRFLVSLRKITQDAIRSNYTWVPQQLWDRVWTDKALYKKYGLTREEIDFIEAVIRPMNLDIEKDND
jgi:site-specific DNA-methyltransferase (adenine-specific)